MPGGEEGPQRIQQQGVDQHAAHQQQEEPSIGGEYFQSALRHGAIDQAQDAEGRKLDNPFDHEGDCVGLLNGAIRVYLDETLEVNSCIVSHDDTGIKLVFEGLK